MLDEADFIARYDKEDVLGVMGKLPEQLTHEFPKVVGSEDFRDIQNIVLAGMGGSAQPAEFLKTWLGSKLERPLIIVRDYMLPEFVGPKSLVVISSYSGNTEETISALADARRREAKIVIITSGGQLKELAEEHDIPLMELPVAYQPRMAVLYAVNALAALYDHLGWADGAIQEIRQVGEWLKGEVGAWAKEVPEPDNQAKQIAKELVGHPVVVYAGPVMAFAAMKWKIAFNENAKNIAFYNYFPEINHNEFIGWGHPEKHGLKVIELRSSDDHPRVQKRFEVTNRLLSSRFAPIQVQAQGISRCEQLVWTIALGEFTATYLAILNQIDPMPVDLVEQFKKELN